MDLIERVHEAYTAVLRGAVTRVTRDEALQMAQRVFASEFVRDDDQVTLERIESEIGERRWNWTRNKSKQQHEAVTLVSA